MNRKIGVILSYVLMVFEILSTLLLTPLIIRSLGQAEYGVFKLTFSLSAYILLIDFGVGNSIVKYVAKFNEVKDYLQERKFLGITLIFYTLVSLAAAICCALLIYFFPKIFSTGLTQQEIILAQKLLSIVSVNIIVTLITSPFNYLLNGRSCYSITRGFSIFQIIIRIILTAIALMLGFKSIAIVSINLLCTIGLRLCYVLYVILKLKIIPVLKNIDHRFIKEIAFYSSWIFIQMIATQINASADEVLIGYFVPNASIIISIYAIGSQINQYFQSIGTAFTSVLMPGVVKLIENNPRPKDYQNEMIRIGRLILIVLIAVFGGFIIYGKQFLGLWAGSEYYDSYFVATILMAANMFILIQSIGTQILWGLNKHREQAILKLFIVVTNIILTVYLIKWNPLIGATLGTFVSLLLGDLLVMNIVFKKHIGISIRQYYAGLFKGILPSIAISLPINYAFSLLQLTGWFGFIINICVYCLTYTIIIWIIGLNSYEKSLINNIFHRNKKHLQE